MDPCAHLVGIIQCNICTTDKHGHFIDILFLPLLDPYVIGLRHCFVVSIHLIEQTPLEHTRNRHRDPGSPDRLSPHGDEFRQPIVQNKEKPPTVTLPSGDPQTNEQTNLLQ